jgi:hypothetical protein
MGYAIPPSRATEPDNLTTPAVLEVRMDPSDVVRLEIWNNDGRLLVEKLPGETFGPLKEIELWSDAGELSLLLDAGTDNFEYQVSVEIWKRDSIFAPHHTFTFSVTGNGTNPTAQRTVVHLREIDGNLNVEVAGPEFEATQRADSPTSPPDGEIGFDPSMAYAHLAWSRGTLGTTDRGSASDWLSSASSRSAGPRDLLQFEFSEEPETLYRNGFSYVGPALDADIAAASQPGKYDKEVAKFWTDWSVGNLLSLNMSAEEQKEIIDQRPDKSRYVDRFTGLSADLALSEWPYVTSSVWYKEGVRNTYFVPVGRDSYEGEVQSSGVSLSLRNSWSSHSLTASFSDSYDRFRPETLAESVSQSFSSSLFPTRTLSIGAAVSLNEDWIQNPGYLWSGKYFTESVWATISPQNRDFRVTFSQYADNYATLDGATSYGGLYNSITLAFDKLHLFDQAVPFAFTVQQGDYFNYVDPAGSTQDTTFRLQFGAN